MQRELSARQSPTLVAIDRRHVPGLSYELGSALELTMLLKEERVKKTDCNCMRYSALVCMLQQGSPIPSSMLCIVECGAVALQVRYIRYFNKVKPLCCRSGFAQGISTCKQTFDWLTSANGLDVQPALGSQPGSELLRGVNIAPIDLAAYVVSLYRALHYASATQSKRLQRESTL